MDEGGVDMEEPRRGSENDLSRRRPGRTVPQQLTHRQLYQAPPHQDEHIMTILKEYPV